MAIVGAKPKDNKVTRTPVQHDWIDVPDVPYTGERPSLGVATKATKAWWEAVTTLPHCVLWGPGEWAMALDTARLHNAFAKGDMARAPELRLREKAMGTTADARRDLRIRYVKPEMEAEQTFAPVSDLATERRRRLMEAE